jgi:serine/threonine protein kinase
VKSIGKFEIIETLGKGGYGTVYRVLDSILNIERAIKILHPALLADPVFIERFRREAQIVARLNHPNIIPVYEMDQIGEHIYISMKYMPGGSLKNILMRQGRLSYERSLDIVNQVASALEYAYLQEKLIHCDIKPENILFDRDGTAYLGDFGFARALSEVDSISMKQSGGIIGTPSYIAPEIWDGMKPRQSTDVYSLACTFYEMITGQILFSGTTTEVITKHTVKGPKFNSDWTSKAPKGLQKELKNALARNPEDRTHTPEKFVRKLQKLIVTKNPNDDADREKGKDKLKLPISTPWIIGGGIALLLTTIFYVIVFFSILTHIELENTAISNPIISSDTPIKITYTIEKQFINTNTPTIMQHTDTPFIPPTRLILPVKQATKIPESKDSISSDNVKSLVELGRWELGFDINSLALTPDGEFLITDGEHINIWRSIDGSLFRNLTYPGKGVVVSRDGRYLAYRIDETIQLFNLKTETFPISIEDLGQYDTGLDFSPDGDKLATRCNDSTICMWDTQQGNLLMSFGSIQHGLVDIAFSPNGKYLAVSGNAGLLEIWNVHEARLLFQPKVSDSWFSNLVFNSDNQYLSVAGYEGVELIDLNNGKIIKNFNNPPIFPFIVLFSPDGKLLISADSETSNVYFWNVSNQELLHVLDIKISNIIDIIFSPNGKFIYIATGKKDIRIFGIQ